MPRQARPIDLLAGGILAVLGLFAARRLLFLGTVLGSGLARAGSGASDTESERRAGALASTALVVVARNEAALLERNLESIDALREPPATVVLVSDGSTDGTFPLMERWAAARPGWKALRLPTHVAKGAALNAGIDAAGDSELVAFCDADVRLESDCLTELVRAFEDPKVGAASALLWPEDTEQSITSRYCALELWQHQLVTSAAKDRLGLNPPAHGWLACYRRAALERIGGFPTGSLGEDVEATNAVLAAGWRTRFLPLARVSGQLPGTISDYWRQHIRWSRGLHDAAPSSRDLARLSPACRLEVLLHSAGYADRPLFVAAVVLARKKVLPLRVPVGYAVIVAAEALSALVLANRLRAAPRFLAAAVAMLPLDVAASATGSLLQLSRRRRRWHSPRGNGGAPAPAPRRPGGQPL